MTRHANDGMIEIGEAVVKDFLTRNRIGRVDLFKSKFPEHVAKRRQLIRILHGLGLTTTESARVMNCYPGSITYWLDAQEREHRIEARKARYRETRT